MAISHLMELLSIRNPSSPFIHEAEDIHSHFSGRKVNEQLHFYQRLMDTRKRGFGVAQLCDEQDASSAAAAQTTDPSATVSHASAPSLPSPTRTPIVGTRTLPPLNTIISAISDPMGAPGLESQKPLPSFSSIDLNAPLGSKLHRDILARHGQSESAPHPPFLSPSDETSHLPDPSRELTPLHRHTLLNSPISGYDGRAQPRAGIHHRSPSDPQLYHGFPGGAREPTRLNYSTSSPVGPPTGGGRGFHARGPFEPSNEQQLRGMSDPPASSPETKGPLSDILEKTHARIASQHHRNDSMVDRSVLTPPFHAPGPPAQPSHTSYYNTPQNVEPYISAQQHTRQHTHHHSLSMTHSHSQLPHSVYASQSAPFHGAQGTHLPVLHHPTQTLHSTMPSSSSNAHISSVATRKRRGNLPREAVRLFKKWVEENKRYPYPNEAQKQDFERMTGLSLQQINNWFINARRRNLTPQEREEMKKEKDKQSQSGSPTSSRPNSSYGDHDGGSITGLSRQSSHSRGGSRSINYP